ncbi:MAG TPA: hypothetical protein VLH19_04845 [Patescibacteria group bacterium]|nr:hypothetical protein [Patescibacteria group bacterium]
MAKKKFFLELLPFLSLFALFVFLHVYQLNSQGFVGDEASPTLLFARFWDALRLRDLRYLAYPFLFYHDPFRAVFSGTLLQLFGASLIILRLPNVIFECFSFWLLYFTLRRQAVPNLLQLTLLGIFAVSSTLMVGRLAGGDGQAKFLFLLTGILLLQKPSKVTVVCILMSMFTMLDAFVFLPFFLVKCRRDRKIILSVGVILTIYFMLWTVLPYLAYVRHFQDYYLNRGFFYYFSRASEGASSDPLKSLRALSHYTSAPFTLTALLSCIFSFFIKPLRKLSFITGTCWLAVLLLSRSSFHVVMYSNLFFLQISYVITYVWQKHWSLRSGIIALVVLLVGANLWHFGTHFLSPINPADEFPDGHIDVMSHGRPTDEAVKRIEEIHGLLEGKD